MRLTLITILLTGAFSISLFSQGLRKRSPFELPLVKMKIYEDHEMINEMHDYEEENPFRKVRVYVPETKNYSLISHYEDQMITVKRRTTQKETYLEPRRSSTELSRFEGKELKRVTISLIKLLEIFEQDIKRKNWDRILYLDGYFPRFLNNYYYLSCCIFNSREALPEITRIPEDEFDISHNSFKSDARIKEWEEKRDYIPKLHESSKSLLVHLRQWKREVLDVSARRRAVVEGYAPGFRRAYERFIVLYFNKY